MIEKKKNRIVGDRKIKRASVEATESKSVYGCTHKGKGISKGNISILLRRIQRKRRKRDRQNYDDDDD